MAHGWLEGEEVGLTRPLWPAMAPRTEAPRPAELTRGEGYTALMTAFPHASLDNYH